MLIRLRVSHIHPPKNIVSCWPRYPVPAANPEGAMRTRWALVTNAKKEKIQCRVYQAPGEEAQQVEVTQLAKLIHGKPIEETTHLVHHWFN